MKKLVNFSLVAVAICALTTASGIGSAAAENLLENNQGPVFANETENGFAFLESKSGNSIKEIRSLGGDDGEWISLSHTSNNIPVIVGVQQGLPDKSNSEEWFKEATLKANTETDNEIKHGELSTSIEKVSIEGTNIDPADFRPRTASIITPNDATFMMHHSNSYDHVFKYYEIFKDGERMQVSNSPVIFESGLEPNATYNYRIVGSNVHPDSSYDKNSESLIFTTLVRTPDSNLDKAIAGSAVTSSWIAGTSGYLHNTFIPDQYAPVIGFAALSCLSSPVGTAFGGDNRSYVVPTGNMPINLVGQTSRTQAFVDTVWNNGFQVVQSHVAPTTRYVYGNLLDQKQASTNGILRENLSFASTIVDFDIYHSVPNPFCGLGAINYTDSVSQYRLSNTQAVVGQRYPVPNHEISFKIALNAAPGYWWAPAVWRGNAGFECLLGTCATDFYSNTIAGV